METLNCRQDLKGAWLIVVPILLYCVGNGAGLYLSRQSFLLFRQGPGVDPPFYFIREDFIQGACLGLSGSIALALGIYYRKRYPVYAWMAVWMSVLWSGGSFLKAVIIVLKTSHLFTPTESTSSWLTFRDYLSDPLIWSAQIAVLILALAMAILTRNKSKPA